MRQLEDSRNEVKWQEDIEVHTNDRNKGIKPIHHCMLYLNFFDKN